MSFYVSHLWEIHLDSELRGFLALLIVRLWIGFMSGLRKHLCLLHNDFLMMSKQADVLMFETILLITLLKYMLRLAWHLKIFSKVSEDITTLLPNHFWSWCYFTNLC